MSQPNAPESRFQGRNLAREASEVLNYNQQLIQFADSKAGTLILINSLFVAAMGAVPLSPGSAVLEVLRPLTVLASAAAVVLCLAVVMSRQEAQPKSRADLVFYADILKRPNAGHYASEFVRTPAEVHVDDLLHRTYVLAGIAQRKFSTYGWAQAATALSGTLWLLVHVVQAL